MKYKIDFRCADANHRSGCVRLQNLGEQVTLTVERTACSDVPPLFKECILVLDAATVRRIAREMQHFCNCIEAEK